MRTVQIGELKNKLSAYLRVVRAGGEVLIRDRDEPIAKIVPFPGASELDEDETSLVAAGLLQLPTKRWDPAKFFSIGRGIRAPKIPNAALERGLNWAREDPNAGILGRKRRTVPVRARAGK